MSISASSAGPTLPAPIGGAHLHEIRLTAVETLKHRRAATLRHAVDLDGRLSLLEQDALDRLSDSLGVKVTTAVSRPLRSADSISTVGGVVSTVQRCSAGGPSVSSASNARTTKVWSPFYPAGNDRRAALEVVVVDPALEPDGVWRLDRELCGCLLRERIRAVDDRRPRPLSTLDGPPVSAGPAVLSAKSVARTTKTCSPNSRGPAMVCGLEHSSNGPPSTRHSNARTSSAALNAKFALRSCVGFSGASSKLTAAQTEFSAEQKRRADDEAREALRRAGNPMAPPEDAPPQEAATTPGSQTSVAQEEGAAWPPRL